MTEAKFKTTDLSHLLADNKRQEGKPYTHTRIGNYEKGIHGFIHLYPMN